MTREEAEEYAKNMTYRDAVHNALQGKCIPYRKATQIKLHELLDKLEQEPCEDAISRQAVEKITWEEPSYSDALNVLTEVRDKVRALPPVNPQVKTGHWIYKTVRGEKVPCCSVCGLDNGTYDKFNFCPECGAKMMESEDKE